MTQNDSNVMIQPNLSNFQLKAFLDNPKIQILLEDLMTVIDSPFFIEDIEGNLLFGQNLLIYTHQSHIIVSEQIIGFIKGDTKVSFISGLLSHLFNQELLVFVDELTKIPNRRYFNYYLQQEWKCLQRNSQPLSLLLCDLDYFKSYNDFYGHQQGDSCLRQVAQIIQKTLKRPGDMVFRYGGEEFAVVLPNTSQIGAEVVAEQLLKCVEKEELLHYISEINSYVTISIGVSTVIPSREFSLKVLFNDADIALYKAKETGRNRYCVQSTQLIIV